MNRLRNHFLYSLIITGLALLFSGQLAFLAALISFGLYYRWKSCRIQQLWEMAVDDARTYGVRWREDYHFKRLMIQFYQLKEEVFESMPALKDELGSLTQALWYTISRSRTQESNRLLKWLVEAMPAPKMMRPATVPVFASGIEKQYKQTCQSLKLWNQANQEARRL